MRLSPRDLQLALASRLRARRARDHRLRIARAGIVIDLFAPQSPSDTKE